MKNATLLLSIVVMFSCASLFSGCDAKKQTRYELSQPTKDGVVYRIDKQTGQVLFILAQTSVVVEGTDKEMVNTNLVLTWGQKVSQLGEVTAKMKTEWRDGKLYYIFTVSPYDQIAPKAKRDARFFIMFYDKEGFLIATVPISFAEMSANQKDNTIDINANTILDYQTYRALSAWSVYTGGFD